MQNINITELMELDRSIAQLKGIILLKYTDVKVYQLNIVLNQVKKLIEQLESDNKKSGAISEY